ncbi:MAG: hypothetical protein ABSE49_02600, partial [Polyangiaceae bacterium]
MTLRSDEGRLELPGGEALEVSTRGPGATVRWVGDALELAAVPSGDAPDDTIELVVRHRMVRPRHVWVPHLTPEPGNVVGDAVFRAPAIVLADETVALALIPDLDDVAAADGWRAWADYDHPASTVTLAAGAYRVDGHVFFTREPARLPAGRPVRLRLHVVASTRPEDLENPYGMAARWLWERWGRPGHERAGTPPVARLVDHVVRWAFSREGWADSVWQPVELDDGTKAGAPVFIVDVTRHPSVPPAQRRWRE